MTNIAYMAVQRRNQTCFLLAIIPVVFMTGLPNSTVISSTPGRRDAAGPPQGAWHVTYLVRPSLENGSVGITAVLVGDIGSGVVWRHAGIRSRRSTQSRPEAQDGFGQALWVAVHPQGWTITGGSGGGMQLSYEVTAPGPEPVGAGGVGIGSEAVYAPGKELFLIPDPALTGGSSTSRDEPFRPADVIVEVIFDVPISWRIVVPWEGYGRSYHPTDPSALWSAVLAVGDFRRQSIEVAGMIVTAGIQGRRPSLDSTFIEVARRVLLAGQQIFGAPVGSRLTILLPEVAVGGEPTLRLGASLALAWHREVEFPEDVGALHQLARELLRLWQSDTHTAPHWFAEGATDYLAWLVLLRENLIERESFRQQMLMTEQRYLAHPRAGEWTFSQEEARSAELAETGTGTQTLTSLARTRGVVVALTLDATIARLTGGERRLTDLMGMIYRWSSSTGAPVVVTRNADIMAVCAAVTGGDYLDDFFQRLVFSTEPPPTAAALADIMSREEGG